MGRILMRPFLVAVCVLSAATIAAAQESVPLNLAGAPSRGPEQAPVTLVVFADFAESASGNMAVVLTGLSEIYPEQLRIVFKHAPRADRPERLLAHEAALAAGEQEKFWPMFDLLFANQRRHSREELIGMAAQLELDTARFAADLDSGRFRAQVEADAQEAAALGAARLPVMFVSDQRLDGPVTLTMLRERIEGLLSAQ